MKTLTISPDAWSCPATPFRPLRRRWSSPAEGSSSSSTPRPSPLGRPSSSSLPPLGGRAFLFLLILTRGGRRGLVRLRARHHHITGTLSSPGGLLLLDLLFRHHVRCRGQQ